MAGYLNRSRAGLNPTAYYSADAYDQGRLIARKGQAVVPITKPRYQTPAPAEPVATGVRTVYSGGDGGGSSSMRWSERLGDVMRSKTSSLAELEARRKAAADAARQGVTAGMDAAARRITDTTNSRIARGVAGADGAAITGVKKFSVHSAPDALKQLEDVNYYKNQQANVDKDFENNLSALAVQSGRTVDQLRRKMTYATTGKYPKGKVA